MMFQKSNLLAALLSINCCCSVTDAFVNPQQQQKSSTHLQMDRRNFGQTIVGGILGSAAIATTSPANAQVFLDPAMYGDQELRVAAVDSIKEFVRRAILQNPATAPSFYQLALLDSLSYNQKTGENGPDGLMLRVILSSTDPSDYVKNLQEACKTLLEGAKTLKKKTAITVADAIAIGGAEAIESIGGPVLNVQLGRTDAPRDAKLPMNPPIDLFAGSRSNAEVLDAFKSSGLTEREMTVLLSGLLTLEKVEKGRTTEDWRDSSKPQYRERGKMGRMSEFKRITEEDISAAADSEFDDDEEDYLGDPKQPYIADSFGTRTERFGQRIGTKDIDEKTFNRYVKEIDSLCNSKKKTCGDLSDYGWIATLLTDPSNTVTQTWLTKYAVSNLNYIKDLNIAYGALTQLGAQYTGGKYESLLKNKPRKSLNDDGLNLGF